MNKPIESRDFGSLEDGSRIEAWTLRGAGGLELEVLTYGGIVSRLLVPDRDGVLADVVLGFNDLASYLGDHPYFGTTPGRVAGRISAGTFELDGKTYSLPINDPPNHLHGGPNSIDKKIWKAEVVERADAAPSLRLTYHSPDGTNGYPGAVDMMVTYTVTADNAFVFETEARSTQATPVNLTHHSYFNLAGEGAGTILDHRLRIDSESSFETDEKMTLLDSRQSVEGRAADFREEKCLGDVIDQIWMRHGDCYWLGESKQCRPVARLRHLASGRVMQVATTNNCLQLYSGAYITDGLIGKSGTTYPAFGGVCFECQGYPNAIGLAVAKGFGDIVVHPGKPQQHVTIYSFSTES